MSELIVIGYETPEKAEEARSDLMTMSGEYLVDVADAVVAIADADGKVKLNQLVNMWSAGATGGAFWGLLVGMLFFNPLLGVAVGAGAGALSGALTDYGINDDFMKGVGSVLQPGQAALFMMIRTNASDKVIERLGEHGGRVLRTNLDTDAENHLRRAFDEAHKAESGAAAPEHA
ncbi:DUF1269 domain-containing protein [Ponticoccus alexandrii]|uniref:DUF1269 domain-containing protein n=1 Tax=Ponticoccus alexandrii TaxID=1943633 RepID=A0ABX7FDJ4_9RHOB|nr:DUF1269 domain-containing protein [Ponticoccus alexandrii]ETA50564.1 membrane protein [Rhodobacteraceae bacterium PD-2]QRF68645.1 DUF1269 domain-containing protein [Ponticoccus alexandrii]